MGIVFKGLISILGVLFLVACGNNGGDDAVDSPADSPREPDAAVSESAPPAEPSNVTADEEITRPANGYPLEVVEAIWKEKQHELRVKVRGAVEDEIVITAADNPDEVLGTVKTDSKGLAHVRLEEVAKGPCEVRIVSRREGNSDDGSVNDRPSDCE